MRSSAAFLAQSWPAVTGFALPFGAYLAASNASGRGARIELDSRVDLGRKWQVVGDESHLRRIYPNLVENALRYSPVPTTLTLGVVVDGKGLRA